MPDGYNYMKEYCVCNGDFMYIAMRTLAGQEITSFPVTVYNVDEVAIGVANNKQEYIDLWNSNAANLAVGFLSGLIGPFSFTLRMLDGTSPSYVLGEPTGSSGNFIIDSNGDFLIDADGSFLVDV